eukprot:CAMPEP_0179028212 /NCGR_PEP_ID=MMETSP0796-20121207/9431_1 /TAXON_ID=73915 /ORGANISM="Pyrodinium bahamense, Strain pbaha01" /LENGTH=143 /DNA_ID=CAMNT_0020724351 /DNA_START=1 /DNA_END=432 /DNA_ORIENTATION=+
MFGLFAGILADGFRDAWRMDGPTRDSPGNYTIIQHVVRVHAGKSVHSERIDELRRGAHVNVLEVAHVEDEMRVCGLIDSPAGWISLLRTDDGFRWARKELQPDFISLEERLVQLERRMELRHAALQSQVQEAMALLRGTVRTP